MSFGFDQHGGTAGPEWRKQFQPEIDHRLAVWQAYLNTLNAFQGIDMVTGADPENTSKTLSFSRTTVERFVYNLAILDGMVEDDKTPEFKKASPNKVTILLEKEPPDMLGRFEHFHLYLEYWTRLDKLMRTQGMFTTGKVQTARI